VKQSYNVTYATLVTHHDMKCSLLFCSLFIGQRRRRRRDALNPGCCGAVVVQFQVVRRPATARRLQPSRRRRRFFSTAEAVRSQVHREVVASTCLVSAPPRLDGSRSTVLAALDSTWQLRGGCRRGKRRPVVTSPPSWSSSRRTFLLVASGHALCPGSQSDHQAASLALQRLGETTTGKQ